MKDILLKIKTPNKMLFLKGKLSRTPFETIVKTKKELRMLESAMQLQSIEYTVESYVKPKEKPKIEPVKSKKEPKIKSTEPKKPKTILEKISNEDNE
jgi:hypothetical protein